MNNKTPGNDGLTKKIYEAFQGGINSPQMKSFHRALNTKILSI